MVFKIFWVLSFFVMIVSIFKIVGTVGIFRFSGFSLYFLNSRLFSWSWCSRFQDCLIFTRFIFIIVWYGQVIRNLSICNPPNVQLRRAQRTFWARWESLQVVLCCTLQAYDWPIHFCFMAPHPLRVLCARLRYTTLAAPVFRLSNFIPAQVTCVFPCSLTPLASRTSLETMMPHGRREIFCIHVFFADIALVELFFAEITPNSTEFLSKFVRIPICTIINHGLLLSRFFAKPLCLQVQATL